MDTSNNWDVELAKLLKANENIEYIGGIVATVVGVNPLKLSIYGGQAFITEEKMYICKNVSEYQIPFTLTAPNGGVNGTITHEGLKVGDKAAVIATEDNQKFFVIDKVV